MPLREGPVIPMEGLAVEARREIDGQFQAHWYRLAGSLMQGKSVLDVGTGTGYGLEILRAAGVASAEGFDVVPITEGISVATIGDYGDASFDCVLAIDVIEHVEDDRGFLNSLLRVAREFVFVSTPNWNVFHAQNPYHVREYTPVELRDLIASSGFTKPLGTQWPDGASDHRIYVSNSLLEITTREAFDPAETWHNQAVLLKKGIMLVESK